MVLAMARPLRIQFEDAIYHVMSRGNERQSVFRSEEDRQGVLGWGRVHTFDI